MSQKRFELDCACFGYMVSFVLSFFPRDVLDEILNLIESVSEGFPSYSYIDHNVLFCAGWLPLALHLKVHMSYYLSCWQQIQIKIFKKSSSKSREYIQKKEHGPYFEISATQASF